MGNEVTIDTLQIELESDAKGAVSGLDALAATLGKLKSATKGGAGLSAVAKQISTLKTAINGIDANSTTGLSKAILLLRNLGYVKISPSIANQLTKINDALPKLNIGDGASKIEELVSALKPLETLGKSSLSTTVNALNKLPKAMEKIDTRKLYTQIQSLTRIMKPLADEMDKVARGFSAFPSRIQKIIAENEKLTQSNIKATKSYIDFYAMFKSVFSVLKKGFSTLMKLTDGSMEHVETLNLVSKSMGEYAEAAAEYAEQVESVLGIDPKEWLTGQSVLMSLIKGFGVASDRAYLMSQNLNQLSYDLWSLKGEAQGFTVEESLQKIRSGIAGELEPLRSVGYDLSQARLEMEAYNLGITKKISNMTQAEKAELRYMVIMRQSEEAMHDMAHTLDSPANQMRIFKTQVEQASRAVGNLFIPILNKFLPVANAVMQVLRELIDIITGLFGVELPSIDLGDTNKSVGGISAGMEDAAESAKKLKNYTMGFDELNVLDSSSGGASEETPMGGGFGFELPEYDFLSDVAQTRVNEIVDKMKEWLGITEDIDSWADLFKTKLGNILVVVGLIGIGFLAWKVIEGISHVADVFSKLGFGGKTGKGDEDGGGLESTGEKFSKTIETLKGLAKVFALGIAIIAEVVAATLLVVGAIWLLGVMLEQVGIAWQPVIDNGATIAIAIGLGTALLVGIGAVTYLLGTSGASMCAQIGIGIAILAEIGAATALFLIEIWAIGKALDEIGKAWQPVIDNGETIATGIGVGTALLVGIGAVTYLLGTSGASMCAQIGIGIAILAEIGAATALFLIEIWAIGKALDEIGKAWQPVIDNGETIATGIGVGTALLVGIGVVTAALGLATVATGGALPLAIGLGTAILIELALAFKAFCDSLIDVANKLSEDLHPALVDLNGILPELNVNLEKYIGFMKDFAGMTVEYTKNAAISGFSATVGCIVDFFTKDPIKTLADNVKKQYKQLTPLNKNLNLANPELDTAKNGLNLYKERLENLKDVAGKIDASDISVDVFAKMVSASDHFKDFGENMKKYYSKIKDIKTDVMDNMANCINDVIDFAVRIKDEVDVKSIDSFTEAIKRLTTAVTNLPKSKTLTIKAIYETSGADIKGYATGGFPDTGELFVAREAGAEMVGSIGRRTAVANNDQIVAGIASGVADANAESNALLREQNTLLRAMVDKESGIYLDGRKVSKELDRVNRGKGVTIIAGGAY